MILSRESLLSERKRTGYRSEIIEKVAWLMEILNAIAEDSFLKDKLALKGGTALNLFYFDLPRLSVDADFNYIGSLGRCDMLADRPKIEGRLVGLLTRMGLTLTRNPSKHAGGKMIWSYPSALGNKGNVELDLNFMYRCPLFQVEEKDSVSFSDKKVTGLKVLDIHELAAGKLTALLERATGRDFFDVYHLFKREDIDQRKLRMSFVLYSAMCSKKHIPSITVDSISVDQINLKNKLVPVMKPTYREGFANQKDWVEHVESLVRSYFSSLLPFTSDELKFIELVLNGRGIKPELITSDECLIAAVKVHPALVWANQKGAENN